MFVFSSEYLENYEDFAFGEGFFSAEECDAILQLPKGQPYREGVVGQEDDYRPEIRQAEIFDIAWNQERDWLFRRLMDAVLICNRNYYKFLLTGFLETLELARYGDGCHFDWHQDFGPHKLSIRKLSVVVQLSSPEEYEGGNLEFFTSGNVNQAPRVRGTVVVFPSYQVHRVSPITKGVRQTLVAWASGPPFR